MATAAKSKRGGKRTGAGPPKGRRLSPVTRERLRGAIDVKRVIGHLDAFMAGERYCEPHQVSAAKILLDRVMPTLAATDITSDGESIVVERVMFKQPTEKSK
jgi:hypothetical protein